MELSIIPECYVDTNLIETIASPRKGYNHQKGCGTVTRLMQTKFAESFAVGIIDKDKNQVKYLESFELISDKNSLQLFRHKDAAIHHYLILVSPAVEKWILDTAESVGIELSDYNLPDNIDELVSISKKTTSKNDDNFRQLFKAFVREKAENVMILKNWVQYFKNHPYDADIKVLKDL